MKEVKVLLAVSGTAVGFKTLNFILVAFLLRLRDVLTPEEGRRMRWICSERTAWNHYCRKPSRSISVGVCNASRTIIAEEWLANAGYLDAHALTFALIARDGWRRARVTNDHGSFEQLAERRSSSVRLKKITS
jgi:hypothetical protein